MKCKYRIVLNSQLGPKTGTLKIRGSKQRLWGVLELIGHKNLLAGKILNEEQLAENGQTFLFAGKLRTPIGLSSCQLSGIKGENEFKGEIRIDSRLYEISGKKIECI
ncbi:hypothetical protein [Sinanaerobacter chloroacetimidivorans]|uniref:Uncharacterized protein n=1 Tax=Sinanaerobacter chloroacetimidivorans TaxID=2818044 RepID=A0A8J8B238_9FIRM|nr:hypothetical protein [Sinanaerobacter chloroacetimidivorans]MBR0599378.1 hypothetical protein [Sinanaerobacter chloroacetimidivorans]